MKASYFGYQLERKSDNKKFQCDLRDFFHTFVESPNKNMKNQFRQGQEKLFLLKQSENFFLFVITRSGDIVKKIQSENISVSEISDLLREDEHLGFASYVLIEQDHLAFASTLLAPRAATFAAFVEDIFSYLEIDDLKFILVPLFYSVTKQDAMRMDIVGQSTMRIAKDAKLFEGMRQFLGGTPEEFKDVESFEIKMTPRRKQDISEAAEKFAEKGLEEGAERIVIRAKNDEEGARLADLYLAGKGQVSDEINKKAESVKADIQAKKAANAVFQKKLEEYLEDEEIENDTPADISNYFSIGAWPN